ncbi:MAG: DUF4097 family beta strand repeat-containing protein [Gaiellales bacterium]
MERPSRSRVTAITALVIVALVGSIVAGIGRRVHHASDLVLLPPSGQLTISVRAADITVAGGASNDASVESRETWTGSARPARAVTVGSTLLLRGGCPGSHHLHLWSFGARCSLSYLVRTPRGRATRIVARVGDTTLTNLTGPLTATMQAGDLHATGIGSSRVTVRLGLGDAHIAFDRPPVSLGVTVDVGDAHVVLPAGRYAIDAHSSFGDVQIGHGIVEDPSSSRRIVVTSTVGDVHVDASG